VSFLTGHGIINIAAQALKIKIPSYVAKRYCEIQFREANKLIDKGLEEFKETEKFIF
jgi:hypothetical protein